MGLFQKSKSTEQNNDELPQYVDNLLENSGRPSNEEIDERFSIENMSLGNTYSIDQAVALMRDLPDHHNDVVVAVVTKTLLSANINVNKIIDDARQKEASLESEIQQLTAQIEALQIEIANKKEQINVSNAMLEETRRVRKLLERSDHKSNGKQPAAAALPGKGKGKEKTEVRTPPSTGNLAAEAT